MNVAVIGADTESVHAIEQAHKLGHRVIAVDQDPKAPGAMAADVHYRIDISHESEVIDALKKEDIDFVMTTPIGRHLTTIGAVNDALHLPGISRAKAVMCTDKYEFHKKLSAAGLRSNRCFLVNSFRPVDPYRIQYPAIFKPRFGSHGRSVHYLTNPDEIFKLQDDIWGTHEDTGGPDNEKVSAAEFSRNVKRTMEEHQRKASLEDDPSDDYILEEALIGDEYAVDGFMEGYNYEIMLVRRKRLTPPPARQAVEYMVIMPSDDRALEARIRDYMSSVCETLGLKDCMLHADIVINGRDINVIEVSASPAGRHVYDELIPMACGVDPAEQYIRYMSGASHYFQPLNSRKLMLRYFDIEHCFLHGIPDPEEIVSLMPAGVAFRKWKCKMKLLDYLGSINDESSILWRGYYIIEGPDERALRKAADIVRDSFELK
ncbi:MAG: ATP-grasp domain-containing protein [Lachnospiraceae bacterium]|nr:ATP-grasp domain-containing protein [Lachnospiraceae bacterium]